ncbi:MAG: hypothetical protein ABJF10_24380 [Chthoniobacter sp.]|uniref:hypothetical protein n=1 Tax=Chthoniobacter sp. TaxID=2510640 RepID=UPI0032AB34A1
MIAGSIRLGVEREITSFSGSLLEQLTDAHGSYGIKFVQSRWAAHYETPKSLKISETPALTWGTATYITPLAFPLSSALYGRIGVVTDFDASNWKIFDATKPRTRLAYLRWARAQPVYADLLLTVHSTFTNHLLRNQFREEFEIDCVLFHPDQEADAHTDSAQHVWMAVTDWASHQCIENTLSQRLRNGRFCVLLDEDFALQDHGLPIRTANRQIEPVTNRILNPTPMPVSRARIDATLPGQIAAIYGSGGYLHVYIEP